MAAVKVEEYLEDVEHLPVEVRRNLKLMRDIDEKVELIMEELYKLNTEFVKNASSASPSKKKAAVMKIKKLQKQAKGYADDKVSLAETNCLLVEKQIHNLDEKMASMKVSIDTGKTPPAMKRRRKRVTKYCICRDEEEGQMICCDNTECLIEWFHVKCLKLEAVPEGKWYCLDCQAQNQK